MHRTLLALIFAAVPAAATAMPPSVGTSHTFYDPLFQGTVFCDKLEEVRAIATAEDSDAMYRRYLLTPNERNEPTCAAIVPTGVVVDVLPLGTMVRAERTFLAYAVETQVGDITGFALYLEPFNVAYA